MADFVMPIKSINKDTVRKIRRNIEEEQEHGGNRKEQSSLVLQLLMLESILLRTSYEEFMAAIACAQTALIKKRMKLGIIGNGKAMVAITRHNIRFILNSLRKEFPTCAVRSHIAAKLHEMIKVHELRALEDVLVVQSTYASKFLANSSSVGVKKRNSDLNYVPQKRVEYVPGRMHSNQSNRFRRLSSFGNRRRSQSLPARNNQSVYRRMRRRQVEERNGSLPRRRTSSETYSSMILTNSNMNNPLSTSRNNGMPHHAIPQQRRPSGATDFRNYSVSPSFRDSSDRQPNHERAVSFGNFWSSANAA